MPELFSTPVLPNVRLSWPFYQQSRNFDIILIQQAHGNSADVARLRHRFSQYEIFYSEGVDSGTGGLLTLVHKRNILGSHTNYTFDTFVPGRLARLEIFSLLLPISLKRVSLLCGMCMTTTYHWILLAMDVVISLVMLNHQCMLLLIL